MIGKHQSATKKKIGAAVAETGWRRRAARKSTSDMQSAAHWEEDFSTPSIRHVRHRGLWEETHDRMTWD